jgi:uncharacterized membrane protein
LTEAVNQLLKRLKKDSKKTNSQHGRGRRETIMERMLVVVFEDENQAREGAKVLRQLDLHNYITVYRHATVVKNPDGTLTMRESDDRGPFGLLVGTALGALLGAIGGLAGIGIGGTLGLVAGGAVDLHNAWVAEDFVDDVAKALLPGRAAVVAEIEEDETGPVDTQMEAAGATVFRRALSEVKHTIEDDHIAAIKADLAQMRAEHGQARAERKAKLQEKINQLDSKLQAQLQKAKERREAAEREQRAKVELLQKKAAAAKAKAAETHIQP